MIDRLRGVVLDKGLDYLVLEVGGIGFRVQVPSFVWEKTVVGEEVTLHTYLHVRDDAWTLWVLAKEDLSVHGLNRGVRRRPAADQDLVWYFPGEFRQAVINGDLAALTLVRDRQEDGPAHSVGIGERLRKMGARGIDNSPDSPLLTR